MNRPFCRLLTYALLLLVLLLLPIGNVYAEISAEDNWKSKKAEDITMECALNGFLVNQHMDQMRDGNYRTFWESSLYNSDNALTITAPEGKTICGILVKWRSYPMDLNVQRADISGNWITVQISEGISFAQYIQVDHMAELRLQARDNSKAKLQICEITIVTEGELPSYFQVWEEPGEKVDLMVLHGHPDDEILWFGGLIPTYAGELQKRTLVVCAAFNTYHRRLELMDCLWTCGVRIQPIFAGFTDYLTSDTMAVLRKWGKDNVYAYVTELYRKYQPDVVVLQDVKGEYGHGVHKAFSLAGQQAVELSANAEAYPDQVSQYGTWDVPKVYIHLYEENQIKMDWWQPLDFFGGLTAQEIARQAFACHVSQQTRGWKVEDGGKWDNSLYGLYHTTVGIDEIGGDLFENIKTGEE